VNGLKKRIRLLGSRKNLEEKEKLTEELEALTQDSKNVDRLER
jgi:hypothetical protein